MVNVRNGPKADPAEAVSQIAVYAGTPGRRPARQALPTSTQILAERLGFRVRSFGTRAEEICIFDRLGYCENFLAGSVAVSLASMRSQFALRANSILSSGAALFVIYYLLVDGELLVRGQGLSTISKYRSACRAEVWEALQVASAGWSRLSATSRKS
jgi:hypothetical protein